MPDRNQSINTLIGLASIGCIVTGVISLFSALFPLLSGEFLPAAIFLIAAALSFGLIAIALIRK